MTTREDQTCEDAPAPGYAISGDEEGVFAIDRALGTISVVSDDALAAALGREFEVRLHCIEPSGIAYELPLRLLVSGRFPQIVGHDECAALSTLAAGPLFEAEEEIAGLPSPSRTPNRSAPIRWEDFFASRAGAAEPLDEQAIFGALFTPSLPAAEFSPAALDLAHAPPAPSPASAIWAI